VVYVETLAGDIYFEERSEVNRYTLAFERLLAASLHPDDSDDRTAVLAAHDVATPGRPLS